MTLKEALNGKVAVMLYLGEYRDFYFLAEKENLYFDEYVNLNEPKGHFVVLNDKYKIVFQLREFDTSDYTIITFEELKERLK